jgi:hypothetical protein
MREREIPRKESPEGRQVPCASGVKRSPIINNFQLTFVDLGEGLMITSRLNDRFMVILVITCNYKKKCLNNMDTYYHLPAVEVPLY